MQIIRSIRDAYSYASPHQQRVPVAQVTGWCSRPTADAAVSLPSCSYAPSSSQNVLQCSVSRRGGVVAAVGQPSDTSAAAADAEIGIHDIEELRGIRANLDSQDPVVEYRTHWKDGSPDTWELASNLSPDLIRDFDERWWQAAKKGDVDTLTSMLKYGRDILSQVVDDNRRSALHFVAAIGNTKSVKLLIDAGADINLQDKEGYTPLHMASGYMHTGPMTALLEAGADPQVRDKQGRDVVLLVENLRKSLPPSMGVLQRIMALEQVAAELTDRLYEEVEPARVLEERSATSGSSKEYLVQYKDDIPDEWLPESMVAPDLIEDWSAGLERAAVAALLDVQQFGTEREYLVQWADGKPDSWEDESHIPDELVQELKQRQPELFKGLKLSKKKKKSGKKPGKKQKKTAAAAAGQDQLGGDGSNGSNGSSLEAGAGADSSSNALVAAAAAAAAAAASSREVVPV